MQTVRSKRPPVLTVLAYFGILLLSLLPLSQAGVVQSEAEASSCIVEYVNGRWIFDGKPLMLTRLGSSSASMVPIRIVDLGRFFEALERAQQMSEKIQIRLEPENDSWPCRIFLELQGERAVIEPLPVIIVKIQINGTISPGYADPYGPYSSVMSIQVYVSWTPTDQVLTVICYDIATGQGWLVTLTGGSGWANFSTDLTRTYKVLIWNPQPPNTKTIAYSGTIYLCYY